MTFNLGATLNIMRKAFLALLVLAAACSNAALALAQDARPADIVLFHGRGCPHCAAMRDYLSTLHERYPQLRGGLHLVK
jgi:fructose-specific component phosphotransferase system IIB-like protein